MEQLVMVSARAGLQPKPIHRKTPEGEAPGGYQVIHEVKQGKQEAEPWEVSLQAIRFRTRRYRGSEPRKHNLLDVCMALLAVHSQACIRSSVETCTSDNS